MKQERLTASYLAAHRLNCVQIVAASPVAAKHEVHNTYGELGNADLVTKYGFALLDNPFDAVLLDKEQLVSEARRCLGDRACRQRCRFLAQERCAAQLAVLSAD